MFQMIFKCKANKKKFVIQNIQSRFDSISFMRKFSKRRKVKWIANVSKIPAMI